MRILSIGNFYPPHSFGGYEVMWQSWVERSRSEGNDDGVLASDNSKVVFHGVDADRFRRPPPGPWRWRILCLGRGLSSKGSTWRSGC
ncbi:MAG: hypothetical protein M3383_02130 [Actinomycetota bacterium]|nr:hypothetical protein [Actinomycetota bacterium]